MECSVRNGEVLASAEALTVSEQDLQRIKQQGCGTSLRDRNIMRLPDLKAFTYPSPTNVPVEVTSGSNNKYMGRESVNAEGFVPPFVNQQQDSASEVSSAYAREQENLATRGSSAVPALAFAGTGEIGQLNEITFGSPPVLYKQIASSIIGEPVQNLPATGSGIVRDPETPLGRAGIVGIDEMQNARELQQKLYGSSDVSQNTFLNKCIKSIKGFLYDILHFDEAKNIYGQQNADESGLSIVFKMANRDGRLPHIMFVAISITLVILLLYMIIKPFLNPSRNSSAIVRPLYTYCCTSPQGIPIASSMPVRSVQ